MNTAIAAAPTAADYIDTLDGFVSFRPSPLGEPTVGIHCFTTGSYLSLPATAADRIGIAPRNATALRNMPTISLLEAAVMWLLATCDDATAARAA